MAFLESRERQALTLRFVEEWEYHEIAAAKKIPIGTVQWRVFNTEHRNCWDGLEDLASPARWVISRVL